MRPLLSSGPILLSDPLQLGVARYLCPVSLRHVPMYRFDVVVVGGGVAGSTAAIAAAGCGASVALLSKGDLMETNTSYAQGGVASVLAAPDAVRPRRVSTPTRAQLGSRSWSRRPLPRPACGSTWRT